MGFPQRPSGSLILVSWPCPEGQLTIFSAIQAYLSRTFHLVVDFLGLGNLDVLAINDFLVEQKN